MRSGCEKYRMVKRMLSDQCLSEISIGQCVLEMICKTDGDDVDVEGLVEDVNLGLT